MCLLKGLPELVRILLQNNYQRLTNKCSINFENKINDYSIFFRSTYVPKPREKRPPFSFSFFNLFFFGLAFYSLLVIILLSLHISLTTQMNFLRDLLDVCVCAPSIATYLQGNGEKEGVKEKLDFW